MKNHELYSLRMLALRTNNLEFIEMISANTANTNNNKSSFEVGDLVKSSMGHYVWFHRP